MPRAWPPSGVRSGSSPGRASTRASVARLVALQALSAWIRSVPVVMSSCYAKSASLCPEWPVGDVPRDMPPEASWTAIRSPRTSTRGVGFLPAALLPGTPCTGGNFPLPICWVCRLESVYGIARQFLSDEGVRRSRLGVDPGGRVAGEPLENCQKTAGGHWPLGCVLPGAWRVSKSQATGGRRWGKRDPPDGQCRGVVNRLVGWS